VVVADSIVGAAREDILLRLQAVALPEEYMAGDTRRQVGTDYRQVGLAGLAPLAEDDDTAVAAEFAVAAVVVVAVAVAASASLAGSRSHNWHTKSSVREEDAVVEELSIDQRIQVQQLLPELVARLHTTLYNLHDSAAWAVAGVLGSWESG